jgi:hypothetical protein
MLHKDFVSQGQTVNQIFYREVLEWFKASIETMNNIQRALQDLTEEDLQHCIGFEGDYIEI